MALQNTDIIVVQRPATKQLYHCAIKDLSIDTSLATEEDPGIVRLATLDEVIDGIENDVAVSPLNMALAFESNLFIADGNSGAGEDYSDDTVLVGVAPAASPPASETVAGIVRLATADETEEGTDGTIAITPFSLRSTLDSPAFEWDGGIYAT
jgi:hypothetical protein